MKDNSNNKQGRSFWGKLKKEVSKDIALFTVGAVSATFYIINKRRQQRLKDYYKKELKAMKKQRN